MTTGIDISIVIVNFNTLKLTWDCVRSIVKNTAQLSIEILVVDNGSTQPGIEQIKVEFPEIILIKSERNLGFSRGNNLGIPSAQGRYILLLNSDTYLVDNAFLTLRNYMNQHQSAGVLSSRLIFPEGRVQNVAQRFPAIKYSLIELLRIQKLLPNRTGGKLLLGSFFDHNENAKADWVWGACFMFRRELLERLPGNRLDERYFMYCEDMQWCRDIKQLGYEVHYCAEATIVHVMGGSSGPKNEQMKKNHNDFMSRNYPQWYLFILNFINRLLTSSQ